MKWEDIIKARTRARSGGSKPDRRKVQRLKRNPNPDELSEDVRARKFGEEAEGEGWEQQLREEDESIQRGIAYDDWEKWVTYAKPGSTYMLSDRNLPPSLPEIKTWLALAGERIFEQLATFIEHRGFYTLVADTGSEKPLNERPPRDLVNFPQSVNQDFIRVQHSIEQEMMYEMMGDFTPKLLTTHYGFDEPEVSPICFCWLDLKYPIKRSTGVASRNISQHMRDVSTERYRSVSDTPRDHALSREKGKMQIFMAYQIVVEWVNDDWHLVFNLFKFSTATEMDKVQVEWMTKNAAKILAEGNMGDRMVDRLMEKIPQYNLKTAGKKKQIAFNFEELDPSAMMTEIKSFFSYYLRLNTEID